MAYRYSAVAYSGEEMGVRFYVRCDKPETAIATARGAAIALKRERVFVEDESGTQIFDNTAKGN